MHGPMNVRFNVEIVVCDIIDVVAIVRIAINIIAAYILLFNDQIDAQFIFVYVYFNSLHVSSIQVLIIGIFNCINTISGICHSM